MRNMIYKVEQTSLSSLSIIVGGNARKNIEAVLCSSLGGFAHLDWGALEGSPKIGCLTGVSFTEPMIIETEESSFLHPLGDSAVVGVGTSSSSSSTSDLATSWILPSSSVNYRKMSFSRS